MRPKKQKRLESAGWRVGKAAEFLGLDDVESRLLDIKSMDLLVRLAARAGLKPKLKLAA